MKRFFIFQFILFAALIIVSCGQTTEKKENSGVDYSGQYNVTGENACQISVTLKKDGESYNYVLTSDGVDYSGKINFEKQDSITYIVFNGKIEKNEPGSLSGELISDNSGFIIQNYGNSMNEYIHFENCDQKYLEFMKVQK